MVVHRKREGKQDSSSNVKQESNYVSILDKIVFALCSEHASFPGLS